MLQRFLLRGAVGNLALQGATAVLSLGSSIVLARLLGADGLGAYTYALTWANLLLIPATLGLGNVLAREVAVALARERWGIVSGLVRFARAGTVLGALAVLAVVVPVLWLASDGLGPRLALPLWVSLPLVALNSQTWVARHAMMGLRRVVWANWTESVVRPALFLAGIGLWWASLGSATPSEAMAVQVAAAALSLVAITVLLRSVTPSEARTAPPETLTREWLRSAAPLLLLAVFGYINREASVFVLGTLGDEADVGVFRVADRVSSMLTYVQLALNQAFYPLAATMFANGELRELERLAIRVARAGALVSGLLFVVMVAADAWLLGWFGADFEGGGAALWVLGLSQLFNVAAGPVGVVLLMSRNEDDNARALGLCLAVTLVLNVVGVQVWGFPGAVWSTAASRVLWNVLLLGFVYHRLGLVLGAWSWRRS